MLTRDDDGALAIIVALFAVMMFVLGALVVEAGTQRESRRDAQTAADAGALAAVAVLAKSGTRGAAVTEAAEYGVANNFPLGRTVANYFDGCTATVPSGWQRSGRTSCVSFKPDDTQPGKWSAVQVTTPGVQTPRLFGVVVAPTRALAQASIEPGVVTSPPVIFAGSNCPDAVRWATINVTGDIHSNGNMWVGSGTVAGEGTYRGMALGPGTTTWTPAANNPTGVGADEDTPRAFPKTYDIDDFRPGGFWQLDPNFRERTGGGAITRGWLSNPVRGYLDGDTLEPGIYYTTGNITIDGNLDTTGATFVSDGARIRFGGAGTKTLAPYAGDLQAFSTESGCTADGVDIAGTTQVSFGGVIYSPNARIRIRGASGLTTSSGSVEGGTVQGSNSSTLTLGELPPTIVDEPTVHLSK